MPKIVQRKNSTSQRSSSLTSSSPINSTLKLDAFNEALAQKQEVLHRSSLDASDLQDKIEQKVRYKARHTMLNNNDITNDATPADKETLQKASQEKTKIYLHESCTNTSLESMSFESIQKLVSDESDICTEDLRDMSNGQVKTLFNPSKSKKEGNRILKENIHLSKLFIDDITYLFEELKASGQRIFTYEQLPHYLRDNESILTGYRVNYSFKECLGSIFQIHNETGNIWTHLLGALFFITCMIFCWAGSTSIIPPEGQYADYIMMTIFLISAFKCLMCSTIFHTFIAHHNSSIFDTVAILDYTGISILIFGSFIILVNYGLYCWPTLRWIYFSILGSLCLFGVIMPWFQFFRKATFRIYRAMFFLLLGFASGAIALHVIYLNGWKFMNLLAPMEYYVIEVFCYLVGVVFYTQRIPERWFPGKLDHFLHSHQLWHVFVFMGAYFHYSATVALMHSRLTQDTCSTSFQAMSHSKSSPFSFIFS